MVAGGRSKSRTPPSPRPPSRGPAFWWHEDAKTRKPCTEPQHPSIVVPDLIQDDDSEREMPRLTLPSCRRLAYSRVMPTLLLDARAALGESPRWCARDACLYWTDIAAHRIHRFDPATGANITRQLDEPVGCLAPRARGGLVLGMRSGIAVIDAWDAPLRPLGPPFLVDLPDYRCNDACTDAAGHWWLGSVDEAKSTHDAALYRIAPDGAAVRKFGGMTTCNGAAFSPDGRTFYHADTPTHAIRAFDHDPATGTLGPPRLLHQFVHGTGRPDGAAVDAEGCIWSALFDGGRVVRLSPAGELLATIDLPVSRPTMISFGGDDGRTAFVTSARKGLSAEQLAHEPLAGGLFTVRVDVPGLIAPPFAG